MIEGEIDYISPKSIVLEAQDNQLREVHEFINFDFPAEPHIVQLYSNNMTLSGTLNAIPRVSKIARITLPAFIYNRVIKYGLENIKGILLIRINRWSPSLA